MFLLMPFDCVGWNMKSTFGAFNLLNNIRLNRRYCKHDAYPLSVCLLFLHLQLLEDFIFSKFVFRLFCFSWLDHRFLHNSLWWDHNLWCFLSSGFSFGLFDNLVLFIFALSFSFLWYCSTCTSSFSPSSSFILSTFLPLERHRMWYMTGLMLLPVIPVDMFLQVASQSIFHPT